MSDEQRPTNGQRAALAMAAVNLYARSDPAEHPAETAFFFDFERDALPGGDQDRLAGLLSGLMHYAERRGLGFEDALTSARQEYQRQRTAYAPGDPVRRAGPSWRAPAPGDPPVTGEVISARPGHPAEYLVDFITSRELLREPDLAPAPPFPALTTAHGTLTSAYTAHHVMNRILRAAETAYLAGQHPAPDDVRDLDAILAALSGWSGLRRGTLLRAFSNVITEKDGLLIAGAATSSPVTLAAASSPASRGCAAPGPPADPAAPAAAVLSFRKPQQRSQGPSQPPATSQPITSPKGKSR